MELKDTVKLMLSEDYKDRMKAEYWQLEIRLQKLLKICNDYENGVLKFKPFCSLDLLQAQADLMTIYMRLLKERAKDEKISLKEEDK